MSVLLGNVGVQFQLAHAEDDVMKVRFFVTNLSSQVRDIADVTTAVAPAARRAAVSSMGGRSSSTP